MSLRGARSAVLSAGLRAKGLLSRRGRPGYRTLRKLDITQEADRLCLRLTTAEPVTAVVAQVSGLPEHSWEFPVSPASFATDGLSHTSADLDLRKLSEISPDATPTTIRVLLRLRTRASAMPRHASSLLHDDPVGGSHPVSAVGALTTGNELAAAVARGEVAEDSTWSGLIPCGRFLDTKAGLLAPVQTDGSVCRPYVTKRGNLVVAIDRSLRPAGVAYLRELSVHHGRLALRGDLATRHSDPLRAELVLVGRTTGVRFTAAAQVDVDEDLTRRRFGLRHSTLRADLDIAGMDREELAANEVLDAWLEIGTQDSDTPHRIRIGRTPYLVRRTLQAGWRTSGDKTVAITPYLTFRAKRVSFHVDVLDTDGFELLQDRTRRVARLRRRPNARPVWLVGERPYKAQDTGLAFFRYMRERHPEIDTYYVIDRSSPEVKNLAGLDNILWYQSKEHIDRALVADRFIGSHHPEYLYPTWLPQFRRAVTGTKVFLQHGVMGTKWLVPMYGKHAPGFSTDLFLVSSEREREYIVSDFGYAPDEVVVTGLSRFDTLFANDVPVRRNQILIIPTWREWLQDPAGFEESDYLQQWRAVLCDPRLRALANSHGSEVIFCLHPNMQQYRTHFEDAGVTLISQGDVDVQHLVKQSAVMMTDYSSVGFDFSFLGKPVIYFQFDRDRFVGRNGSHLDLDSELPGPVGFTADSVLGYLSEVLDGGGLITAEYASRADRFVAHRDRRNCDRIFSAIEAARPSRNTPRLDPELRQLAEARFRRSHAYFPMMKRSFNLWRRLPIDQELIVFESGVGKQYSDSPRYIYEELVRRGDTRTKVWAYSGKLPVTDPHTITVKRLSPEYYWYLARAKYWVNNQSFPHYLTRRPDGVYIQTWHGTPLKRMQHDLEEVHGRDPDYLARVTAAMQQWSVLLSPSPYATRAFRSAFRYQGPVLELGYPRNDILADPARREQIRRSVRRRLGFGANTTAVLYAPTFRDDLQGAREGRFRFELPFDLKDFANSLDDNTVLLLRMHVLVDNDILIPQELRHRVLDVSSYLEIQELFLASDVLVTDYSSVFFDYAILRRPIIFYAYDLERYRDRLRGFYLDYLKEVPGPVVEDPKSLWNALQRMGELGPNERSGLSDFAARYAPQDDGRSSQRVVDELL